MKMGSMAQGCYVTRNSLLPMMQMGVFCNLDQDRKGLIATFNSFRQQLHIYCLCASSCASLKSSLGTCHGIRFAISALQDTIKQSKLGLWLLLTVFKNISSLNLAQHWAKGYKGVSEYFSQRC